MLYNPDWKKEAKSDVHSLESLIQWLEGQNPEQVYTYTSNHNCLLAQYYKAKGYKAVSMGTRNFSHGFLCRTVLPPLFNGIAASGRSTFGSALDRARGYQRVLHAA